MYLKPLRLALDPVNLNPELVVLLHNCTKFPSGLDVMPVIAGQGPNPGDRTGEVHDKGLEGRYFVFRIKDRFMGVDS